MNDAESVSQSRALLIIEHIQQLGYAPTTPQILNDLGLSQGQFQNAKPYLSEFKRVGLFWYALDKVEAEMKKYKALKKEIQAAHVKASNNRKKVKMRELTKNTQAVLDELPATAKELANKLGLSRPTVSSHLRVLIGKGLAKKGETMLVPHGEAYAYLRTSMSDAAFSDVAEKCVLPKTTLTQWRGSGKPFAGMAA